MSRFRSLGVRKKAKSVDNDMLPADGFHSRGIVVHIEASSIPDSLARFALLF